MPCTELSTPSRPISAQFTRPLLLSSLLLCLGTLGAVEIEAVILKGNRLPDLNDMSGAYRMAVNNRGDWAARIRRNSGDVVAKNGVVQVDNNSPDVSSNSIYSLSINNHGDVVSSVYRKDAKVGDSSNGRQIYLNKQLLVTPGQASAAPQLPVGTVYRSIYDAAINDQGSVFVMAVVEEAAGQSYQTMTNFTVDSDGRILKEELVYEDGSIIPAGRLSNPPRSSWQWEPNNQGQLLHYATLSISGKGSDQSLMRDWDVLFQEDTESPIPGREAQFTKAAHLNDSGDWVALVGFSDASVRDQMIMLNGKKFVELGDTLRNGGTLKSLIEPVFLDNDGDVYWLASWTNPDESTGTGLFLNDSIVVESDVTPYQGDPLRIDLGGTGGTYGVSDNGDFILFSAYWNGSAGLFRAAVENPLSLSIVPAPASGGLLELRAQARIDVPQVRLLESYDLRSWEPPTGPNGSWITRPAAGWESSAPTWTLRPGVDAPFYRVIDSPE